MPSESVRNPKTPQEWQAAVDKAHFYRLLADCQMYGLITGAENVNVERCDWILYRGALLGYNPKNFDAQFKELLHAK